MLSHRQGCEGWDLTVLQVLGKEGWPLTAQEGKGVEEGRTRLNVPCGHVSRVGSCEWSWVV